MSDIDQYSDEGTKGGSKIPGAPGAVVVAEDPAAPSRDVSSKRQSLSDLFTIVSVLQWKQRELTMLPIQDCRRLTR